MFTVRIYGNILPHKFMATHSICPELLKIAKALWRAILEHKGMSHYQKSPSNSATRIQFFFTYSICPIRMWGWNTDKHHFLAGTGTGQKLRRVQKLELSITVYYFCFGNHSNIGSYFMNFYTKVLWGLKNVFVKHTAKVFIKFEECFGKKHYDKFSNKKKMNMLENCVSFH